MKDLSYSWPCNLSVDHSGHFLGNKQSTVLTILVDSMYTDTCVYTMSLILDHWCSRLMGILTWPVRFMYTLHNCASFKCQLYFAFYILHVSLTYLSIVQSDQLMSPIRVWYFSRSYKLYYSLWIIMPLLLNEVIT
jgi:hypothetical protein